MELYHVLNRGVDGRPIFLDNQDRARFVHDLYEFNDTAPAQQFSRIARHPVAPHLDPHVGRQTSNMRERLVDIHGWKLMPNHFHLLLSARVENGIELFLRKMGGYARYFNERHGRRGPLFAGTTKKVLIERETHFLYILHYIHLNALDDSRENRRWRERDAGSIAGLDATLAHLRDDRWSSYRDYCGITNFPSILTKTPFEDTPGTYERELREFLEDRTFESLEPQWLELE